MTSAVRPTARRWPLPSIFVHGGGPFEGAGVLEEIEGPLGFLLFQLMRDVELWGASPPKERAGVFRTGASRSLSALLRAAGADARLKPALRTLVRMTEGPEGAQDEQVALACGDVAHWADENEFPATAVEFARRPPRC